jgi:hypothetical protein
MKSFLTVSWSVHMVALSFTEIATCAANALSVVIVSFW